MSNTTHDDSSLVLIGAVTFIVFAVLLLFVVPAVGLGYSAHLERQGFTCNRILGIHSCIEEQHRQRDATQVNQEQLAEWKANEWEQYHEDRFFTFFDGSPGVERCTFIQLPNPHHYTITPDDLKIDPSSFEYAFRPEMSLTQCPRYRYNPETGEVG